MFQYEWLILTVRKNVLKKNCTQSASWLGYVSLATNSLKKVYLFVKRNGLVLIFCTHFVVFSPGYCGYEFQLARLPQLYNPKLGKV